jgi:hypothetical protein
LAVHIFLLLSERYQTHVVLGGRARSATSP